MLPMSDYEIGADGGKTYIELFKSYPSWPTELHSIGHIMEDDKLQHIFSKGIMLWYIKYIFAKYGIPNDTCTYPPTIRSFYDFKMGMKLLYHFDRSFYDGLPADLKMTSNYTSWQVKIKEYKNSQIVSFNDYFKTHEEHIEITKRITEISKIFEGNVYNIIIRTVDSTILFKLGIVFQRWKIVLEKISGGASSDITYSIDMFLTQLQQIIYYHLKYMIELFINSIKMQNTALYYEKCHDVPDYYSHPDYSLIITACKDESCFLFEKQTDLDRITYNVIAKIHDLYG